LSKPFDLNKLFKKEGSMKKLLIVFVIFASPLIKAEESHPCKNIEKACEAAGFVKGQHKEGKGKGLWIDCMQKLKNGETVEGVNVAPAEIEACKAKVQEHKEHKAKHKK
jgi:hypothetical protein